MASSRIPAPLDTDITTCQQSSPALATLHRLWHSAVLLLGWVPPRRRFVPQSDVHFSWPLNFLFGLASTATAANMYYSYPVLNKVAAGFDVSYEGASLIPTLLQAGYGAGILFICPLGDRWRLRPLILGLITSTLLLWVGLCICGDFRTFCALSFVTGFTTVTPQLMLPLASALAPPARRATAISIVFSGLMLGILLPRVLSGVVTELTSWRTVYWVLKRICYVRNLLTDSAVSSIALI